MEKRRIQLQEKLVEVLGSDQVFFQKPINLMIKYPCLIYSRISPKIMKADNKPYVGWMGYEVIGISKNPDNDLISKMLNAFQFCYVGNSYIADNLYHQPFTIYY